MSNRFTKTGGREAVVHEIPNCDLCKQNGRETPALYDGATTMGPWAYMCQRHFTQFGLGLGEGRGQKLFTADTDPPSDMMRAVFTATIVVHFNKSDDDATAAEDALNEYAVENDITKAFDLQHIEEDE